MKRYQEYKASGNKWVEKIPNHWSEKKLKQLGVFTSSGIDKKTNEGEETVKMVNYTDIYGNQTGELNRNINYMVVSCPKEKKIVHQVRKGDMIFTPSSETADEIGLSALVDEELPETVYSYHVIRLRFTKPIAHRFKKYLCNNSFVLNQFSKCAKGTTRQILSREDFKNIEVFIPSENEQEKISFFLDKHTKKIDDLISKKERMIELLKEERAAIVNQAVTKGLDSDVEMKDSGIEWLGKIPKHWTIKRLKYVGEIIIGLTYSPDEISPTGTLVLRASNIRDGKIVLDDNVYLDKQINDRLIVKTGDILICSRSGSRALIGKCAYIDDECAGNSFGAFMTVFRGKSNRFIYHVFNSTIFTFHIGSFLTSTINQLTTGNLSGIMIAIPPEDEQTKIANYLDNKTKSIDDQTDREQKSIELLKEYRTALISEVVTGKFDVRENA